MAIVDRFNNDPNVKHLVLTLGVGETGLNLTAASTVIFNCFAWTSATHTQAEDRAYGRLNDLHGCNVWYVQVADTVDEHMFGIIKMKQALEDAAVDGVKVYATEQLGLQKEFLRYLRENR